jgi:hypothetical protein
VVDLFTQGISYLQCVFIKPDIEVSFEFFSQWPDKSVFVFRGVRNEEAGHVMMMGCAWWAVANSNQVGSLTNSLR